MSINFVNYYKLLMSCDCRLPENCDVTVDFKDAPYVLKIWTYGISGRRRRGGLARRVHREGVGVGGGGRVHPLTGKGKGEGGASGPFGVEGAEVGEESRGRAGAAVEGGGVAGAVQQNAYGGGEGEVCAEEEALEPGDAVEGFAGGGGSREGDVVFPQQGGGAGVAGRAEQADAEAGGRGGGQGAQLR